MNKGMSSRPLWAFRIGLPIAFFTLGACVSSDFAYLASERYAARPANYSIEVLPELGERPYVLVGKASAGTGNLGSQNDCINALREQARQNGGDALVGMRMAIGDPGTVGANKKSCQADVVRWK